MYNSTNWFTKNIPVFISCLSLFAILGILTGWMLKSTGGVFMYPLDDPFIHMQLAKNLAIHNTWGINPGEFASASSSILYTIILAGLSKIFSPHILIPFIVNCIAAFFLLVVVQKWLQKQETGKVAQAIILLAVVFLTPLPVLVVSGMEHTLQCLFSFLFITKFADWLTYIEINKEKGRMKLPYQLVLYAILVASIRYEGLFLIGIACLMLLYKRKIGPAFQLGFLACLPVILFGVYSVSQGSYFLPNSVLVKSEQIHFSIRGVIDFIKNSLIQKLTVVKTNGVPPPGTPPPGISLLATQRLLVILPLCYLFFSRHLQQRRSYAHVIFLLLSCTLLHLSFAATGWFYRYEAYLIMCSVPVLAVIIYKYGKLTLPAGSKYAGVMLAILGFYLFFPAILRSSAGFSNAKQASVNIYQQQCQMARFINDNYDGAAIAANDIGAVSYFSNVRMIDLWGLGNIQVARSKKDKHWTPVFLDSLVRKENVKVAMVYDEWFDPAVLQRWTKVATWQIFNNVICGGDIVSFYAINIADKADLESKLRAYQTQLPGDIKVVYMSGQ